MKHEEDTLPDDATEDSIVTVARWRFRGRVVATIGTVIAGVFAAVVAYYGALS